MKKLNKKEMEKAIDFIVNYDMKAIQKDRDLYALFYHGIGIPYKDYTQKDIEEFLQDNCHLSLKDLIN